MPAGELMPTFQHPPITEVVCGLTFKPLKALLAPHVGLFWASLRSDFPTCREVEPLVPVIESFEPAATADPQQDFPFPLMPRIWFISKDNNGIIQVQRDRLMQNWRKVRATDEYPRYTKVKADFQSHIRDFSTFLAQNQLGSIDLEQLEITYINHIPQGEGWASMSEIAKVFPDFSWRTERSFLPLPEGAHSRTTFLLPNCVGRLHVAIQTATRRTDGLPVFVMELTVRGLPKNKALDEIWPWFDLAREWIVRGFTDLTGNAMHDYWKRQT